METTLRAVGTQQQQEEGGKRAETKLVVFLLLSPMIDCVVLVIEPTNLGYVYQRYYRDHDDS